MLSLTRMRLLMLTIPETGRCRRASVSSAILFCLKAGWHPSSPFIFPPRIQSRAIARDRDFFFFACLLLMEYNLCLPLLSLAPAARDRRMISQTTRALLLNFNYRFFSRFVKSGPSYSDHPQCRRITYSPVGTRDACISKSPIPGKPLFCAVLQTSQKMLT